MRTSRRVKGLVCLAVLAALLATAGQCAGPPLPGPSGGPAVRVAVLTPMSGELATFGEIVRNGVLMAFDEWNERGGPHQRRLEWVLYDSACEPETARQATAQAITDGLDLMVGPLCAETAIPAAGVAQEAGAFLISPTAGHPSVTVDPSGRSRSLVFRAAYVYGYQGEVMARFARSSLAAERAAIFVAAGDDYAQMVGRAFAAAFEAGGGQALVLPYEPGTEDVSGLLQAALDFEAQALFLPDRYPMVNRLAGEKAALGLGDVPLLGPDSWRSSELNLAALEGSYFILPFYRETDAPGLEDWAGRYKAAYAIEPDALAMLGYEAGWLLAAAIDQAGDARPKAVADTLAGRSFTPIAHPLTFDANHNPRRALPVVRIRDTGLAFETYVSAPIEE